MASIDQDTRINIIDEIAVVQLYLSRHNQSAEVKAEINKGLAKIKEMIKDVAKNERPVVSSSVVSDEKASLVHKMIDILKDPGYDHQQLVPELIQLADKLSKLYNPSPGKVVDRFDVWMPEPEEDKTVQTDSKKTFADVPSPDRAAKEEADRKAYRAKANAMRAEQVKLLQHKRITLDDILNLSD